MNAMFEKRKDEDFVRDNITPQTNADRIRDMNDEEMAEFIDKVSRTCLVDALGGKSECNTECRVCKIKFGSILEWLKSEVKR